MQDSDSRDPGSHPEPCVCSGLVQVRERLFEVGLFSLQMELGQQFPLASSLDAKLG